MPRMDKLFSIEHGKVRYWADFALYGLAILLLIGFLIWNEDRVNALGICLIALFGFFLWTFLEYVLHRHILHGVQPFKRWHLLHHERPRALICAPTILSASLISGLIFLPAHLISSASTASALTVGLLVGYLGYALVHHASHHWRSNNSWLARRKLLHAKHHFHDKPRYYGVTSAFWDRVFGSV